MGLQKSFFTGFDLSQCMLANAVHFSISCFQSLGPLVKKSKEKNIFKKGILLENQRKKGTEAGFIKFFVVRGEALSSFTYTCLGIVGNLAYFQGPSQLLASHVQKL